MRAIFLLLLTVYGICRATDSKTEELQNVPIIPKENVPITLKKNVPISSEETQENVPISSEEIQENVPISSEETQENVPISSEETQENVPISSEETQENVPISSEEIQENEEIPENLELNEVVPETLESNEEIQETFMQCMFRQVNCTSTDPYCSNSSSGIGSCSCSISRNYKLVPVDQKPLPAKCEVQSGSHYTSRFLLFFAFIGFVVFSIFTVLMMRSAYNVISGKSMSRIDLQSGRAHSQSANSVFSLEDEDDFLVRP